LDAFVTAAKRHDVRVASRLSEQRSPVSLDAVMRFAVSAAAAGLASTLAKIGAEIEPDLHLVSQAARDEWRTLQSRWRPGLGREEIEPDLTDEEIEALEAKVRRFRDIVHGLAPKVIPDVHSPDARRSAK
jgi:hypothetical protein